MTRRFSLGQHQVRRVVGAARGAR